MHLAPWIKLGFVAVVVMSCLVVIQGAPFKKFTLPKSCPSSLNDERYYVRGFSGTCYWFVNYEKRGFQAAESLCAQHGGILLEIKTSEVLEFIVKKMKDTYDFESPVWLNINHQRGAARWSDMSCVKTSLFQKFEISEGFQHRCFEFDVALGGTVSEIPCSKLSYDTYLSKQNNVICQIEGGDTEDTYLDDWSKWKSSVNQWASCNDQRDTTATTKKSKAPKKKGKSKNTKKGFKSVEDITTTESTMTTPEAKDPTTTLATTIEEAIKSTTEEAIIPKETDKPTTEGIVITTKTENPTTEADVVTIEATKPTTEAAVATTEAAKPTTEAAVATTEAAKQTTEAAVATTEAAKPTTEAAVATTEAAKQTTEAAVATTEAAKPTTEAAVTTIEAAKPTTEAAVATTEAAKPTTEAAVATTEAAKPTTEAAVVTTKAAKPTTEAAVPTTEAAKPTTEAAEEVKYTTEGTGPVTSNPTTELTTESADKATTTPKFVRKVGVRPNCNTFLCQKNCMMFGYKKDPVTKCPICECDFD